MLRVMTTSKQLGETTKQLTTKGDELSTAEEKIRALQSENDALKETPQYHLDLAVKAAEPDTDEGDAAAIKEADGILARWPDDPVAATAKKRKAEWEARIKKRADDLRQAQAQVRQLIGQCHNLTVSARNARNNSLAFNEFNDIDVMTLNILPQNGPEIPQAAA